MSRSSSVSRLILLVSCAHALVHLLELSLSSVEQVISDEFSLSPVQSGMLGSSLRLPYGLGALIAGLIADRFGEKRILVLYLFGAAITCVSFLSSSSYSMISVQMFSLGAFASMYHPAGLALLANETTLETRARALGTHGVFGSLGIAFAPLLAGVILSFRPGDWRGYYVLLGTISAALAVVLLVYLKPTRDPRAVIRQPEFTDRTHIETKFQLWPYVILIAGTGFAGTIYGGVLHFLPRYLKESAALDQLEAWTGMTISDEALGNYSAALALVCGAFGQWTAGRIARPKSLPLQLSCVYAANIPLLIWMAYATGTSRLIAASLWAFVHFMNQPLYNSLLPEFLPRHRRSVGYGLSNMMGFGIGAVGPPLVGLFDEWFSDYTISYLAMAGLAFIAAMLPLCLLSKIRATSR